MGEVGPSCVSTLLRMVLPGRRVSGHKWGFCLWAVICRGLPGCLVLIATCCALQILGYFDYAFTAIFTVEILLKVMHFP